ncbi:hypothetical protein BIFCAT_01437 [Bifidobacterium catenulatum DSM 16992 = JCM 1194 = LMG 11043]|uniref:Uncharacterized protein n=1 Tax=Bifidobacterium catenulatum DSM 16992 = JCM 1194 = LMG 11043 TaxID=566552 RepID=B6XW48_9BIFI|nr:hypothetical protein BIFCAT_01437 [Bifidobacterium catenulatum DSM 16992 = JCM 1194 = LMG 11043]
MRFSQPLAELGNAARLWTPGVCHRCIPVIIAHHAHFARLPHTVFCQKFANS